MRISTHRQRGAAFQYRPVPDISYRGRTASPACAPRLSFEQIADDLYTLAPADFTAARDNCADQLTKAVQELLPAPGRFPAEGWSAHLGSDQ
ncbi:hypothetical protein [Kitasatospora sp. NPDC002965]|uniref:hypothetical protein n=1 Tax=Kitasatospora sp. NPDC002965 TaxID=3154775 RepID=UPI0033AE3111